MMLLGGAGYKAGGLKGGEGYFCLLFGTFGNSAILGAELAAAAAAKGQIMTMSPTNRRSVIGSSVGPLHRTDVLIDTAQAPTA